MWEVEFGGFQKKDSEGEDGKALISRSFFAQLGPRGQRGRAFDWAYRKKGGFCFFLGASFLACETPCAGGTESMVQTLLFF